MTAHALPSLTDIFDAQSFADGRAEFPFQQLKSLDVLVFADEPGRFRLQNEVSVSQRIRRIVTVRATSWPEVFRFSRRCLLRKCGRANRQKIQADEQQQW